MIRRDFCASLDLYVYVSSL